MNYLTLLLLALIQGAAELLPVSSSAHVILAARLLAVDTKTAQFHFLLVMLHTGTMFAVLFFFWGRWRKLLQPSVGAARTGAAWNYHILKMVFLATIVTGVLGLGLKFLIENVVLIRLLGHEKGEIEQLFSCLPLMGVALCVVGLIILAADFLETGGPPKPLSATSAILIGLIQGLCLPFRGFSRSGATISMGLWCGLSRRLAEEFSFALAVVLTPAVIVHEFRRLQAEHGTAGDWSVAEMLLPGAVGMICSFLAGLLALKLLSAVLEAGRWRYFGFYCLIFAGVVFTAAWYGL